MYYFSRSSKEKLITCRLDLQFICNEAISVMDFSVIWGRRNKQEQNFAYKYGFSKKKWPESRHNFEPPRLSEAIDLAPYPIDWTDKDRFILLAGIIKGIAYENGIRIRWGGDWDGDNDLKDQTFFDYCHYEITD